MVLMTTGEREGTKQEEATDFGENLLLLQMAGLGDLGFHGDFVVFI